MKAIYQQLHLPLELNREPSLAEYLSGPNSEAVSAIAAAAAGSGEPFMHLFGAAGTGKTHLLQAACLAALAGGRRARFVPLGTQGLEPSVLDGLEQLELVSIDDVERIAGAAEWETALFNLFNRMRERGRHLITAASAAPDALPLVLPDLVSRLLWGPRYCLQPLSEVECARLLTESAIRRGLRLSANVVAFIMRHHARDPASLMELLARVDSLCLREQRQPSIPLVRRIMEEKH